MAVVAAVDCGATSIRVCRVDLAAERLTAEVVHRVEHRPVRDRVGSLRWDWSRITESVTEGLDRCVERGPVDSIGVDTWAVDYGLLDVDDRLVGDPYSYRDHRTDRYREIADTFGVERMYRINGLQLQPFNTVFQLAVHDAGELERAERLLWLPELLVHHLTGVAVTERTSAVSSGLVDVRTGDWSTEMLDLAGIDAPLCGSIESAGQVVGSWHDIPVSLVAGHDTASAVAGMGAPGAGGTAFVSSGTWMLVGTERSRPDTSTWAMERNFTNEAGATSGFRFLRNVTGFWIFEQCRRAWDGVSVQELMTQAAAVTGSTPLVDVDDPALRAPDDMLTAYTGLAGLPTDADPGLVVRSIVESIAHRVAEVVDQLAEVGAVDEVLLFGGAARIDLLTSRLEELSGRPVVVGASEAAALGNAIVQGIAVGAFDALDDGRARVDGPGREETR